MKRWVFVISTGLSTFMMIAAMALWGFSYLYDVRFHTAHEFYPGLHVWAHGGKLGVHISRGHPSAIVPGIPVDRFSYTRMADYYASRTVAPHKIHFHRYYGFGYMKSKIFTGILGAINYYGVFAPFWFVVVVTGILPSYAVYKRIRYKPNPNACKRCAYDLTGTLAAGRESCPECGENIDVGTHRGKESVKSS